MTGLCGGSCVGVFTLWQSHLPPLESSIRKSVVYLRGPHLSMEGLKMPGLTQFLRWLSDPYTQRELRIDDSSITSLCGGKSQQFRWRPARGFDENEKFSFPRALKDEASLAKLAGRSPRALYRMSMNCTSEDW